KIQTRQGLFDMPTFITSINDNKILREKIAFCIKISLKLMGVGEYPLYHKIVGGVKKLERR
ncbi:hypothetical protein, partial [Bacillus proteolyticus]|uniref:hypothetical protein n=1 Tax=Bacillus proteolyticus TaxID=2026192 RepID=UPI00342A918A